MWPSSAASMPRGRWAGPVVLRLQQSAGNRAVVGRLASDLVLQRDRTAAADYTSPARAALGADFYHHHTPHGSSFERGARKDVAIANHDARGTSALNTTIDMSPEDAQREISRYLEGLGGNASRNLVNERYITFTTRGEYPFVTTDWNDGDPTPTRVDRGFATVTMQWVDGGDYYQIYHLDGMS